MSAIMSLNNLNQAEYSLDVCQYQAITWSNVDKNYILYHWGLMS